MSEYLEEVEREHPKIVKLVEAISQELRPVVEGTIFVGIVDPGPYNIERWDSTVYVFERTRDKILGLIPRNKDRPLIGVHAGLYGGAYGRKDLHALVFDEKVRPVASKELVEFAKKMGLTGVYLENGNPNNQLPIGSGEGVILYNVGTEPADNTVTGSQRPTERSYTARRLLGLA